MVNIIMSCLIQTVAWDYNPSEESTLRAHHESTTDIKKLIIVVKDKATFIKTVYYDHIEDINDDAIMIEWYALQRRL